MSNRSKIVNALVTLINTNLDGTTYTSNIYGSAENKLKFWDEISSFPYLSLVAGDEYREYQPGNFKWAYLNCIIRIYTQGSAPEEELEQFFEDLENLLDVSELFETPELKRNRRQQLENSQQEEFDEHEGASQALRSFMKSKARLNKNREEKDIVVEEEDITPPRSFPAPFLLPLLQRLPLRNLHVFLSSVLKF